LRNTVCKNLLRLRSSGPRDLLDPRGTGLLLEVAISAAQGRAEEVCKDAADPSHVVVKLVEL